MTVTYPFHPLAGQSVHVVGETEHGGSRHLIIRKPSDGAKCLLPEWMTSPAAGVIRIVSCPRLSVNRLVELRGLIDRLMASSLGTTILEDRSMTRWMPPEPDLFKTSMPNELSAFPRRTNALELLKMLLTEAISITEAGSIDQEGGDDQDHA